MGIELVMVFDGAPVPCKKLTEDDRNQSRLENLRKAIEIERTGNIREAEKFYTRAVDVTPAIAKEIMDELKKYNIECIVAPYEADAQLAYLCRIGYIDGVISEDSDLIVFGSTKILYKLEHNGNVQEFLFENLWKHPNYNMTKWTHDQFIMMCVLAGCDYLKSFKNFGLKSAYKIISQSTDIKQIIFRLKKIVGKVPENYENLFLTALNSFKYHRVFCPIKKDMVHLTPLPRELENSDLSFLGESISKDIMIGIAFGRVHPCTKQSFEVISKRKIDDIFPTIQKNLQVKKIKVCEETKTIAQKIRAERNTQKSKYFDECEEEIYEEPKPLPMLPSISDKLKTQFKPHIVAYDLTLDKEKNCSLRVLENLQFKKIDLNTIFTGNYN